MTTRVPAKAGSNAGQLKAVIDLLLSDELARSRAIPLHHAPESLSRSPAKVEILVHSLLVFIERGIDDITVQDLLDAAGISRRTFYKYFRNKVDVLESLYKLAIDVMIVRFKAQIGHAATVDEAAEGLVDVFFGYHRDLGSVIRLMQEEAIRSGSPLAPHREAGQRTLVTIVNEELRRIVGRPLDPLLVQALLWAMESTSINLLRSGVPDEQSLAHGREVLAGMARASFAAAIARG